MSSPNILLCMADQLPAATVGAYGHPLVQTPNIDSLAEAGTTFEAAYCNCPICGPSRSSMVTGRAVAKVGAFDNGSDFAASVPTFMHHLRRAGYETLLAGKMHFVGPDQLHGFERRLTPEIYPSSFVWTPDWRRGAYANPGTAVDQLAEAGVCDWSMQLDYDEEVSFRALEALRDLARRRQEGRPFFLCASFTHPHDPFIITREWWELYDHRDIEPPAAPSVPMQEMHPYNQWLQIHHMVDVYPPDEHAVFASRHAFYGMVSYLDHQVGRLLGELERLGMADDTVVLFTSDHGEMLGEHGMWFKRTYFDSSTRVPLLVRGPSAASNTRVAQTVSLIDLFPTLLEIAGLEEREQVQEDVAGDSLCQLLQGGDPDWKDYALGEYYSEGVCQPMRMAVRDQLKYVYVHQEKPQLFDLAADPHEQHNCVADPAYAERLGFLTNLVHHGWDPDAMRARVLESQQQRRWINQAMARGRTHPWDGQPDFDAATQYVRQYDAQETSRRLRYPRYGD